jgi:hypothetical protein
MVTRIKIQEIPAAANVLKANKSSTGLTVAQKKLLKRKYKEAEALRGSVSSAWGRQAISALKNPSTFPSNVPHAREGVRRQAGRERTRRGDVKLTSAKERAAWHKSFLQPQAILTATIFLACLAMVAGVRPDSRAVTAEMSDLPPIMAALRVEALEAEFANKVVAPADTGGAGNVVSAAADAVELTTRSQADRTMPEVEAKPVSHLASANFVGAASSATSAPTPPANTPMIQVARIGGQIKPAYAGMWGADQSACSTTNRKRLLPTMIDTDGARAGETFCRFKKKQESQSGWNVVANCSNGRERWVANVRLKVQGERLTWSSERGSQAYVRCEPGMTMAQAN